MRCNQVHAHPEWLRLCRERPGDYVVSAPPHHAGAAAGAAAVPSGAPQSSGRGPQHDGSSGGDFGFALGPQQQQQPPPPFHQQHHHAVPGAIGSGQGGTGSFTSWHVGDTSPIDNAAHAPPPAAGASVGGAASYIPQSHQQQQKSGHPQMHPSAVGQPSLENSVTSPTMLIRSPPKKPSGLALALSPKLAAVPPAATLIGEGGSPGVSLGAAAQRGAGGNDGQTPTPQSPTIITSATGGVNTPGTAPAVRKTRASPTHQPYASAPGFSSHGGVGPSMDSPTFSAFLPGAHRSTRSTAMGLQLAPGFPTFNPSDSCEALPPPAAGDASLTSPTAIPTHHASTPSRGMRPRNVHSAAAAAAAQALQQHQQHGYGAPSGAHGYGAGSYPHPQQQQQQPQQQAYGGYSHQPYGTGSGLLGTEPNTPLVSASPSRQHPPPLTSFAEDPSQSREFGMMGGSHRRMPPTPGIFAGRGGASAAGGLVSPSGGMSFNVPPGGILPSPVMGAHFSFSGIDDPLLPPPWAATKGGAGTPTHPNPTAATAAK
jgi:hypothetical protein